MRDGGTNRFTAWSPTADDPDILPPAPFDALSNPTVEDLLPSGLALWPRGAAWGTPDGAAPDTGSVLSAFTRAALAPFAELYARLWRLTEESRATTLVDSLVDWEADFGLPDDCSAQDDSPAGRRRALISKVRGSATITPLDFVRFAYDEGFRIEIEEPATFECGFSECGGAHRTGPVEEEAYWTVHVFNLPVDYFTIGESETGFDPLFEIVGADRLECLFDRVRPAWTMPIFVPYDSETPAGLMLGMHRSGLAIDFSANDAQRRVPEIREDNYSGPVSGLVRCERASAATFFDASGVLRTAPANILRIDRDPLTGAVRGALIEAEATNRAANSETFAAGVGIATLTKTAAAPDGTSNATIVAESAANTEHYVNDIVATVGVGQAVTWSVFLKAGPGSRALLLRTAGGAVATALFDPAGRAWVGTGGGAGFVSRGFDLLRDGWCRVWMSLVATSAGSLIARLQIHNRSSTVYAGDGASGVILFGRQLEFGPAPTSYIATSAALATRAADAVGFTLPNGPHDLTYRFEDGSALTVATPGGPFVVPTTLPRVRSILAAPSV